MILIISTLADYHTEKVIQHLKNDEREFYLWDLLQFPLKQELSISYVNDVVKATLKEEDGREINLSAITSAWWRRPQPFTVSADMTNGIDRHFTIGECHATISGLWKLLPARWMNPPVEDEVASRKAYQLMVAQSVGLIIPETLISNNPEHARSIIEANAGKGTIYKSFSATQEAWRETRLIKEDELNKLSNVKYAPVIFQEYIHSIADLRITIVGNKVFPAAIYIPDSSYQVDFRMTYATSKIVAHQLPEEIEEQLLHFMRKLNLIYGAIDMRLTPEGKYVFLEVNTAGQWLFMEEPTGLPISKAIADWLANSGEKESAPRNLQS